MRHSFKGGELVTTSDYPIYCPVEKVWAPAGDWVLGKRSHFLYVRDDRVEVVMVEQPSAYSGVFDVYDLTVDHPLHNFVANDILVHNKQYVCPRITAETTCVANSLTLKHGSPCSCAEGHPGVVDCRRVAGTTCTGCGGTVDGGSSDAGTEIDPCYQ